RSAPASVRIVGCTVIVNFEPDASGADGVKVTTAPAAPTVPATIVEVVVLRTTMPAATLAGSVAASNVATAWKPFVETSMPSGVSERRCGCCALSTSAPNATLDPAAGAEVATLTAPSPVVALRGRSANAAAGCAATGIAKTPPVRATSRTPSGASNVLPVPAVTSAVATVGPVAVPR